MSELKIAQYKRSSCVKKLPMLTTSGGGSLVSHDDALVPSESKVVLVEEPAYGYWVDSSGYPALNGIYAAVERHCIHQLLYRNVDSSAELKWVEQGWLLRLADGTDCFLQLSTNQLMVFGGPNHWQAIESSDNDPLAEPPDEVVALLDQGSLDDLIRSKRAHEDHLRRARAAFALPFCGFESSEGDPSHRWWRVAHLPAVAVRGAPSTDAPRLGWKLCGERVLGLEMR